MNEKSEENSPLESLANIALLIDAAADYNQPAEAEEALELCDALEKSLNPRHLVELNYFRANAWSVIRTARQRAESNVWDWDSNEVLREIFHLRSAIRYAEFTSCEPFRQCQILVNAGNVLNHIGRPIEAFEYWNRALELMPNFAMAHCNRGLGLETYAKLLYDPGHKTVVMKASYDSLKSVSQPDALWDSLDYEHIRESILSRALSIESHVNFAQLDDISLYEHSLGSSEAESRYRAWSLRNGLFLSPLNDLGAYPIAAHDVLHLPTMVRPVSEPPHFIGFFNQLKQEYISARFFCWQGTTDQAANQKHFADEETHLLDTMDDPMYSVSVEQIKTAFRLAYSLFDKIAYFINEYWTLGMREQSINIHSIWYEGDSNKRPKTLRGCFHSHPNLPLRGLYWLSKDMVENDRDDVVLGETMEPDAYRLRSIRNHLEHKYLKVHANSWGYLDRSDNAMFNDQWAVHLTVDELQRKTTRMLKLARSGIMYLSLAVHREESLRWAQAENVVTVPMVLPKWGHLK